MALLNICKAGEPVLKAVAKPVGKIDKKILRLLDDMVETMYASDGVGLAAPQVGESVRIVVIDALDGNLLEMINPVIVKRKGRRVGVEGCLSVPYFEGDVPRSEYVICEYLNRRGKKKRVEADDLLSITIQHELDHLDGVLFIDRAISVKPKEQVKL